MDKYLLFTPGPVNGRRGATVTLKDGTSYSLRNSNDIDDDNKGIYIRMSDDSLEKVDWDYFLKVEFSD